MKWIIYLGSIFFITISCSHKKVENKEINSVQNPIIDTIKSSKPTWVFILAGQSNMAGRAQIESSDTFTSNQIISIDSANHWIKAKEPLHFYEPKSAGLDCGISFASELLQAYHDSIQIILMPCAVGGTSIQQWLDDENFRNVQLLTNLEQKLNLSKSVGELKGILWHQGENDASADLLPLYESRLFNLINRFRQIAQNDSLPIFIGHLGSYAIPKSKQQLWNGINASIDHVISKSTNVMLIETSDLTHKGDHIHFDSRSQRLMGQRFAQSFIQFARHTK